MSDNIAPINNGRLSIVEQDGCLVVDSRLVAKRLGIQHESFLKTIRKHRERIEAKFGHLRFEIGTVKNSVGAVNESTFVLLTEPQATALMTISKNTVQVLDCKMELVEAFEKAKSVIKTVIPAQSARLQELQAENQNMELRLKVYEAQQKTLAAAGMLALSAPALVEAILTPGVTVIEKVEHIDRTVIVDGKGNVVSQFDGIGITAIQKQFGFKSTKAAWAWLESIGYGKDTEHWKVEPTKVDALKLDRSVMSDLKAKFSQRKGNRQKLLGE